jgi:uncharacterized membrane protein
MAKKYDTNPLDPDFPEKAKAAAAAAETDIEMETQTLPYRGSETRRFAEPTPIDAQTRKFAPDDVSAYSTQYSPPFNGQYVPANYSPYGLTQEDRSHNRKVAKIGLPENILTAVPYIPWWPGFIAGLVLLFLGPKSETKVRFHAAQALAAHVAIWIVGTILGIAGSAIHIGDVGSGIFSVVMGVMLVIFAIRAWQGKAIHIQSVDVLTNWLEEKITPRS